MIIHRILPMPFKRFLISFFWVPSKRQKNTDLFPVNMGYSRIEKVNARYLRYIVSNSTKRISIHWNLKLLVSGSCNMNRIAIKTGLYSNFINNRCFGFSARELLLPHKMINCLYKTSSALHCSNESFPKIQCQLKELYLSLGMRW